MSQTNEFAKANNPDYVYFDLQTSNVYNNEVGATPQLQFLESRDSPIIANSGDYYMSVTRFQVDTEQLPTLIVEPDINHSPFSPEQTIHKVAIINNGASLAVSATTTNTQIGATLQNDYNFGNQLSISENSNYLVIGQSEAPTPTRNSRGTILVGVKGATGTYQFEDYTLSFDNTALARVGSSLMISKNGVWISVGTDIGITGLTYYTYILKRDRSYIQKIPKPAESVSNVAICADGSVVAIGYPNAGTAGRGIVEIWQRTNLASNVFTKTATFTGASPNIRQGMSIDINYDGTRIAVGSYPTTHTGGRIEVYQRGNTSSDFWGLMTTLIGSVIGDDYDFGRAVSLSKDGRTLAYGVGGANDYGAVYVRKTPTYFNENYSVSLGGIVNQGEEASLGKVVHLSLDGTELFAGMPDFNFENDIYGGGYIYLLNSAGTDFEYLANIQQFEGSENALTRFGSSIVSYNDGKGFIVSGRGTGTDAIPLGQVRNYQSIYNAYRPMPISSGNEQLPVLGTSTIASVLWSPNYTNEPAPSKASLTGKNTALFKYYYCNSYARFIEQVNNAILTAYSENFNLLWNNWIEGQDILKNQFIDIVTRAFPTAPYLEWSNSGLIANLIANMLFASKDPNYRVPSRLWNSSGSTSTDAAQIPIPLNLQLAFNASLYSLFNSFPATETIINNEKFYILNLTNPAPTLRTQLVNNISLYPRYPFLDPYINVAGLATITYYASSMNYPYIQEYIVFPQELSTIDTWCPINAVVFTSNTLPIVINQFSANTTLGKQPAPTAIGNDFALIITDLQTNQQGYKPNILYNPSAEYRRIDMTGNQGIRNIDINVFWRTKTGLLIPFVLGSGGCASLKILFEKKEKAQKQKAQFANLSIKELQL